MAIGQLLPEVLDELHYHTASPADEAAQQLALQTLIEACVCAAFTAKNLNYTDLAHLAAQRAEEAAALLGNPIYKGKADYVWLNTLPRAGSGDRNLAAAERAADELEPHARDPLGLQVLGMISLSASLSAAALRRSDGAAHWLDEAAGIARRVPDQPKRNWQSFSGTNVWPKYCAFSFCWDSPVPELPLVPWEPAAVERPGHGRFAGPGWRAD